MKSQKIVKSETEIKAKITLPLKRSGLIGSTTNGFYFIDSRDDLLFAYQHHKEKIQGIQKTLALYKERGRKLGIKDFD